MLGLKFHSENNWHLNFELLWSKQLQIIMNFSLLKFAKWRQTKIPMHLNFSVKPNRLNVRKLKFLNLNCLKFLSTNWQFCESLSAIIFEVSKNISYRIRNCMANCVFAEPRVRAQGSEHARVRRGEHQGAEAARRKGHRQERQDHPGDRGQKWRGKCLFGGKPIITPCSRKPTMKKCDCCPTYVTWFEQVVEVSGAGPGLE